eukprot:jgi/Ulvmu1/148/UM001_0152.1
MYAHKSCGYNALIKSVLNQGNDQSGGFAEGGNYSWIASAGRLHIWRSQDGSYAALTTLWSPGVLEHVWVYHYPNTGALTVAACASNGDLHTWLDANASPNPITTPLRTSQSRSDVVVESFAASAVNGPDAPGFVAAASFSDGCLAMASAARGRVSTTFLKEPATSAVAPRGLFSAINDAVGVQEEQSWMHGLMGGEGRWWLQRAIGSFVGATQRDHASGSPCRHLWLQHSGGSAWVVLALTESTLDCWRVSHMGGSRDVTAQCMWSFALGAALARFDRRASDAGAMQPLRLQVQGDAVCVLCAIKERLRPNTPAGVWNPALALLKLPPVNSSGVWATVPDCHFFKKLELPMPDAAISQQRGTFALCMRPDAAAVSRDDPSAILITLLCPRFQNTGAHRGSQLVAWCAQAGATRVLDQVSDAAALAWEAEGGCWQLLSPIFGVLLVRQAGAAADASASVPVMPLLEAAVARQRSGDSLPGLAEALQGLGALTPALPPQRNAVAEFSHALVNTLSKSALVGGAAAATAEVLVHKQQAHGALLQCLHNARLLEHGAASFAGPKLPAEAVFEIFQHSEHLTAVCCLYHDCSAPSTGSAQRAELLEALALASRHIEAPSGHHITSSDWAFSSPTLNLPLLMRGVLDACADSVPSAASSLTGEPSGEASGSARVAALTDVACAAFRGARSARQAAAVQFGAAYEPRLERGSGGWLASAVVRDACVALARHCLAVAGSPSGEWLERVLQLASHLVASYKSAVDEARAEGASAAAVEQLVHDAQTIAADVLTVLRSSAAHSAHAAGAAADATTAVVAAGARRPAQDAVLRQRLLALASTPLESASQACLEPRLVSVEHLLALCEEHIHAEHAAATAAAGRPGEPLRPRLLAELSNQMKGFAAPFMARVDVAPLTPAEHAAQQQLHSLMLQHAAFMRHVLRVLCSGSRAVELLLLPAQFYGHIQQFLASDERWRGMAWLFHNARGNFPEAASALAALVRDGDPSGHAASVLVPPGVPRASLPARAALLNKATTLLKMRAGAAAAQRSGAAPAISGPPTSLDSMGAPAAAAVTREYEEAEVMLAALRLRTRVAGSVGAQDQAAGDAAVQGLDVDAVISEAAASDDVDVLLEGVAVASRIAACNAVWLERQRDAGWAALWAALAQLDVPCFRTAIAASDTPMGMNAGDLSGSVVGEGFKCTAELLRQKPAQAKMATDAAVQQVRQTLSEATGGDRCGPVVRDMLDRALAGAGLHAAAAR